MLMYSEQNKNNQNVIKRLVQIEQALLKREPPDKLKSYNSGPVIHQKQLQFHRSKKRNRWLFGGNRTGKTECGAVETVWLARGIHPFRENKSGVMCWVVSVTYAVQRDVAQKKILSYLNPNWIREIGMIKGRKDSPANGVIDFIEIDNVFGSTSLIGFKSADQGRETFQGASLDFVWFDEEPPEDIYEECKMRVLDRKGELFATMTPLKGLSWVYEQIYLNPLSDPEIFCMRMEWADNPFLSTEETVRLSASMNAETLHSRRDGGFGVHHGLVYASFDPTVHVVAPFCIPHEWKDGISIDPGLHNPLACLFFAVDYDGNVYVAGEHYAAGKDIGWHTRKIEDLAEQLRWPRDEKGRLRALIDSAASQHTLASAKSVQELFYEEGILTDIRVDKSLFAGIANVQSYLEEKRLFIFESCVNLIREIKRYRWGSGDVPQKTDDHALDALRYYLMARPEAAKYPVRENEIQLDKKKVMQRNELRKHRKRYF